MSDKPVCAVIGFGPQNGEAFARRSRRRRPPSAASLRRWPANLGPTGVHVSLLIIDGRIGERGTDDPDRLDPDDSRRRRVPRRPAALGVDLRARPATVHRDLVIAPVSA
jgi:hypothetical protein